MVNYAEYLDTEFCEVCSSIFVQEELDECGKCGQLMCSNCTEEGGVICLECVHNFNPNTY